MSDRRKSDPRSTFTAAMTVLVLFPILMAGCRLPWMRNNQSISHVAIPNPVTVHVPNHEFVWNQIVDEVDNYFKIKREERVRVEDGIVTEGVLTTYPTPGSTLLEPWHKDSTSGFEKLHATLQTIRRTATVRLIPSGDQYQLEVTVVKEMEDLATPEHSTVGGIRSNVTPEIERDGYESFGRRQKWYPVGRDASLEQKILSNILERLKV